jgi:hypothetical protein
MGEPGLDRHEWETEVMAALRSVREITRLSERNADVSPREAATAVEGYRSVYEVGPRLSPRHAHIGTLSLRACHQRARRSSLCSSWGGGRGYLGSVPAKPGLGFGR